MRRKPQAGACSVCGCAVVRPTAAQIAETTHQREGRAWANGHLYHEGVLQRVLCPPHEDRERGTDWGRTI